MIETDRSTCSVGRVLASYRSGKLPKAFKIIPTLKNWEEVCPNFVILII